MTEFILFTIFIALIATVEWLRYRNLEQRRPNQVPRSTPVMWQEERLLIYACIAMFFVLRFLYASERRTNLRSSSSSPDWVHYIEVGAWAVIIICGCIIAYRRVRWKNKAVQFHYELCPHCGYALKGLPQKHVCPECGKAYDLYQVKRDWNRATRK